MPKFSRFDAVASFSVMNVWRLGEKTVNQSGPFPQSLQPYTLSQMQLDDLFAMFALQISFDFGANLFVTSQDKHKK